MSIQRAVALLASLLLSTLVQAEAYRWVDPATGRTIVSDQPPPASAKGGSTVRERNTNPEGLSFAARRAAGDFPVVLYTANDCADCASARALLVKRGVPFTERLLQGPEDAPELNAAIGGAFVPTLKVGRQFSKGFAPTQYDSLLDMAGYPAQPAPGAKPVTPSKP